MSEMRFEAVEQKTREEILRALDSGDPDEIHRALDSAAYWDEDWRWAQEQLLRFADAENETILSAVALGFTFLAVFHGELDEERVMPVLERLKSHPRLRGMVEDVEEDIEHFVRASSRSFAALWIRAQRCRDACRPWKGLFHFRRRFPGADRPGL